MKRKKKSESGRIAQSIETIAEISTLCCQSPGRKERKKSFLLSANDITTSQKISKDSKEMNSYANQNFRIGVHAIISPLRSKI